MPDGASAYTLLKKQLIYLVSIRKVPLGPERNFLVVRDNLSSLDALAGAFTGFKRLPGFRDRALKPYHDLLESPAPSFSSQYQEFPDGHYFEQPAFAHMHSVN